MESFCGSVFFCIKLFSKVVSVHRYKHTEHVSYHFFFLHKFRIKRQLMKIGNGKVNEPRLARIAEGLFGTIMIQHLHVPSGI